MKPLIPILVVATTSLAVASVQFGQQASQQRKRADAEQVLRQKQDARVAELERNQARLERELETARAQTAVTTAPPLAAAAQRPATPPPPQPGAGLVASAEVGGPGRPPPFAARAGRGPFGPLDSPASRKYMQSRAKQSIRRLYGDVGTALDLSPEKSNQLLDLLADQQTRNIGRRPPIPDGMNPQQYFEEQQQKNADEIKSVIGADKVADWTAYQKSLPDRMQVNQIRDQLDQAGVPMTESQRTEMLAAVTEESQRLPRPTFAPGSAPEDFRTQMMQWQTDYETALLDRAKQVLNTDQYNAYKEYQDWQSEMRANLPRGPNGAQAVFAVQGGGAVINGVSAVGPVVNFQMAAPLPAPPPPPAQTQRK
jgi:hypothetical protein